MDVKKIIELRKEAEKAVEGMPDGDIKLKAFEVILNHLISAGVTASLATSDLTVQSPSKGETEDLPSQSLSGRLIVLKEEGFFKNPKTLAEIREELQAHGWHYPNTTISPILKGLAQKKKKLRRQKIKDGKKTLWKYSDL